MKKKKLTAEERKRAKAEKKLKQLEKKKQDKRDHLEREIKYSALTVRKYERNWRRMLMSIASDRMCQELEFAWHNFERVIDSKDFTISLLLDELAYADGQYALNLNNHLLQIDRLIGAFGDRVVELTGDYDNQVRQFMEENRREIDEIKELARDSEEYLKTMIYGLELARKDQDAMIRAEYYSKLDEDKSKGKDIVQRLCTYLEHEYQKILARTNEFVKNYNDETKQRRKDYAAIKSQDDCIQELLTKQSNQIKKFYDYIQKLKQLLINGQKEQDDKLFDLKIAQHYFAGAFNELKVKAEIDRNEDKSHIVSLSESCNDTINHLDEIQKRGEAILRLASVCRRLETAEEKILPFPVADKISMIDSMDLFWQRLGQIGASKLALQQEREFLIKENSALEEKIEEYCDKSMGVTIRSSRKNTRVVGVVDANLEMKKYQQFENFEKQ